MSQLRLRDGSTHRSILRSLLRVTQSWLHPYASLLVCPSSCCSDWRTLNISSGLTRTLSWLTESTREEESGCPYGHPIWSTPLLYRFWNCGGFWVQAFEQAVVGSNWKCQVRKQGLVFPRAMLSGMCGFCIFHLSFTFTFLLKMFYFG